MWWTGLHHPTDRQAPAYREQWSWILNRGQIVRECYGDVHDVIKYNGKLNQVNEYMMKCISRRLNPSANVD
jgi:hypothetical protein